MKVSYGDSLAANADASHYRFAVDVKRVWYRAVRYWYMVALSLLISVVIAFLKNRYSTKIYPITASILIKEKDQMSEGRLLYNNPLVSGFRNYLNEVYLIRSYPLVEKTLARLNFGVSFYKEGNVLTTESYNLPFSARVLRDSQSNPVKMYFQVLGPEQFKLAKIDNAGESVEERVYNFNDTIEFQGLTVTFLVEQPKEIRNAYEDLFIFSYTDPGSIVNHYVSRLNVSWAEEGSGVLNLSINGSQPAKEIDFLSGLIDQYQMFDLEKKNRAASRAIEFISDQLDGIADSLRHVELRLEHFKNRNVVTDLSSEAERLYNKLEKLEGQRGELIVRGNYFKYLDEYLRQSADLEQIVLPSSVGINDPIMSSLIQKMIDLQIQLKLNEHKENPLIHEARRKIDEIRSNVVQSLRSQQATDKIRQDYLNQQVAEIEGQLNHLPMAERQLVSIQRNYSLLENLYIFLLQKRAEAGISKASTTSDIEVVNPPMRIGGAIYPVPSRNYLFAILLGLFIPVFGFVIVEVLDTKVQSKADIEKFTSIPFIGGVGHKSLANNLEVFSRPRTAIAESFRALRSNLEYFLSVKEKAVIMVTSSISGEGKSFTSINLASVMTLAGKRTLLVGADMRRPKIFDDFELNNEIGLSSYLAGLRSFTEVVQETSFIGLDVISGGPVPPNPAELLLTDAMDKFISEARSKYDYIIIDTPPLAIVTDALVIAQRADHILFLVRQNYTPKELLKTIQEFYATGKLKRISVVLNDIHRNGPGYGYGYNYGYGYGYLKRGDGLRYYSQS